MKRIYQLRLYRHDMGDDIEGLCVAVFEEGTLRDLEPIAQKIVHTKGLSIELHHVRDEPDEEAKEPDGRRWNDPPHMGEKLDVVWVVQHGDGSGGWLEGIYKTHKAAKAQVEKIIHPRRMAGSCYTQVDDHDRWTCDDDWVTITMETVQ